MVTIKSQSLYNARSSIIPKLEAKEDIGSDSDLMPLNIFENTTF